MLLQELHLIDPKKRYPVYIAQIKPSAVDAIMQEIKPLHHAPVFIQSTMQAVINPDIPPAGLFALSTPSWTSSS
jgi:hypothetical protein